MLIAFWFFAFIQLILSQVQYDESIAILSASYSTITHCNSTLIQNWNCKLCKKTILSDVTHIQNKQTQIFGYIGYNQAINKIIIAWRGTIDLANQIQDISFDKTPYSKCRNCQVHLGFYFSFLSIEKQLNNLVNLYIQKYPTAQIFCFGHSLGAVITTFAALQLQLKYNKIAAIYALGLPRIGNQYFSQFLKIKISKIFRIIHNRDIVPHLPFQWLQFHHPPHEIFYQQDMKSYKICNDSGEDISCSNKFYPNYNPTDHDVYWISQGGDC